METFVVTGGKPTIPKDPAAVLDYTVDWADWLAVVGDTIASATALGDGVTVNSSAVVAGTKVVVWVSGGAALTTASVTIKITTASTPARIDERTIWFKVKNR